MDISAQNLGAAMLTTGTLSLFPAGRALRQHRATTQQLLAAEPAARLLPRLLSLPLGAGPLPDPAAILAAPRSLGLYASPGGGRSLALLQVANRWAEGGHHAPVLSLPLAEADAPNLSPRAVVAGAIHRAGLPAALIEGARPAILLVDDWELLPADRRAIWRTFLTVTAGAWPAMRAVAALPAGEPWPELDAVAIPAPDHARAAAWLAHLLPGHDVAPIAAALRHEPLARVAGSLADLALLALTFPLAGLPASRAELYEQAYSLVRPMLGEETPRAGRAVLRIYRLARGLAGGADLDTMMGLAAPERAAVAPFAAGLLDDPTPVLAPLWRDGDPLGPDLPALAAVARQWPGRSPAWDLRLLERLAAPAAVAAEGALLAELAPALPAMLASAGHADLRRALAALASVEPALGSPGPLLALVDDLAAPDELRWAAADALAARLPAPDALAVPPPIADGTTLAARFFVGALDPASRHLLATPALRAGLEALLTAPGAGARRFAAAHAVAADPALPEELRAQALAAAGDPALLERAAADASAALRRAALGALAREAPQLALAALGRAVAAPEAAELARREALDAAAAVPAPAATGLLARAAIDVALPLSLRLHAVALLATRGPAAGAVLPRLLTARGLPDLLRAVAAAHLGRCGDAAALPALREALEAGSPTLRRAAAAALGALGTRAELREQCAAALLTGLRRVGVDTALAEAVARALGDTGAALALPTLAALLGPELDASLRSAWLRRAPGLAAAPSALWLGLSLPDDARFALADILAEGGTTADPPTRLAELTARQAARVAVAAAGALGRLAVARPDLRAAALAALRRALVDPARTDVVRAALDALAAAGDPAAELAAILDDPAASAPLRWLAVERVGPVAAARVLLLRRLERDQDDPFVQAAVVKLLGALGEPGALPVVRHLARSPDTEPHLRRVAIGALGKLPGPEPAAALTAIAVDPAVRADLRAAAADALPADIGPAQRTALVQAARVARPQPEVAVALARALARSGDREALPTLVRSAQSAQGAEAVASIEAIAAVADPGVAPLFVQISQSHTAAQGVRLAAVAALLRVGGAEHLPLLREYLAAPSPPLRLQAYAALAALLPDEPRLGEPLADPDAPVALRLQALRHVAARDADNPVLGLALADAGQDAQVRLAAAAALATAAAPRAAADLAAMLAAPATSAAPPVLRRRCAAALGALAAGDGPAAERARAQLIALAADAAQPADHRAWAAEELLRCYAPQ